MKRKKNRAAVHLGRLSRRSLTPAQRSEAARQAVLVRWQRYKAAKRGAVSDQRGSVAWLIKRLRECEIRYGGDVAVCVPNLLTQYEGMPPEWQDVVGIRRRVFEGGPFLELQLSE